MGQVIAFSRDRDICLESENYIRYRKIKKLFKETKKAIDLLIEINDQGYVPYDSLMDEIEKYRKRVCQTKIKEEV